MNREYAHRRSNDYDNKPTFDLPHVWKDGSVAHGVVQTCWVGVRNMTTGNIAIRVYAPGEPTPKEIKLEHTEVWTEPCKDYGSVSVVIDELEVKNALEDIYIFWETVAGKA